MLFLCLSTWINFIDPLISLIIHYFIKQVFKMSALVNRYVNCVLFNAMPNNNNNNNT